MDPLSNPPSPSVTPVVGADYDLDFLNVVVDFDFTDFLMSPNDINGSSSIPPPAFAEPIVEVHPSNNPIPSPAISAPSIVSPLDQPDEINAMDASTFNVIGSGSMNPMAIRDQIPTSANTNQCMHPFVNPQHPPHMSFVTENPYINPDHQLPQNAYFQRLLMGQIPVNNELLPQSNYHGAQINLQLPQGTEIVPPPNALILNSSADNFANTIGDIVNHDPVGIACFLAGVVRPSRETQIYRCSVCFSQFPNAQAFGGHMKSHRKRDMDDEDAEEKRGKRKKAKGRGKANVSSTSSSSSSKGKKKKA